MGKLVSVVIPTHSGQDTIAETVQSVIDQTYVDVEIIISDDNGAKTENQILTEQALQPLMHDKRIKYIVNPKNVNGSAARNVAMKAGNGEYIAFLDDDDQYLPECIEKVVETFEKLDPEYGIVFVSFLQKRARMKDVTFINDFDGYMVQDFLLGNIQSPSSILCIRREVVETIGYWDESFFRHQDWEYCIRIMDQYKAYGIPDVLVNRHVIQRHSAKKPEVYEKNRIHFLNKMKGYIEKQPEKIKKQIYSEHYFAMGKEYFKARHLAKSLKYACKTSNPLCSVAKYFADGFRYLSRSNR